MQLILRTRKGYLGTLAVAALLCLPAATSASSASPDEALVTIKGTTPSTEGADARRPSRERFSPGVQTVRPTQERAPSTQAARPAQDNRSSKKVDGKTGATPYRQGTQPAQASADRHGLKRALVDGGGAPERGERKQLSQEERRALQRELREAARGANESRPSQTPGRSN